MNCQPLDANGRVVEANSFLQQLGVGLLVFRVSIQMAEDAVIVLKKWNAVALWAYGTNEIATCAICRDELSESCKPSLPDRFCDRIQFTCLFNRLRRPRVQAFAQPVGMCDCVGHMQ